MSGETAGHGDRADLRLREDRLGDEEVRRIARSLAALHARAAHEPEGSPRGSRAALRAAVLDERAQGARAAAGADGAEVSGRLLRFLDERAALFEERAAAGHVRALHGDPRLCRVLLDREVPRWDPAPASSPGILAVADVCADLACLSLDLARHGRADHAERCLAAYADAANDYDLFPLVDFYEGVRALLEAGAAVRRAREAPEPTSREDALETVRGELRLAEATQRRSLLPPVLVAMGGLVASGKSTVADEVSRRIAGPRIETDRTRAFLLAEPPAHDLHEAAWERAYAPGFTERLYAESLRRADAVLSSRRPVVVDGCFGMRRLRAAARRLAESAGVTFLFVECRADEEVIRSRLRERARRAGLDPSEWLAIHEDFAERWEPVDELPAEQHLVLDTSAPLASAIARVETQLPTWPAGLVR